MRRIGVGKGVAIYLAATVAIAGFWATTTPEERAESAQAKPEKQKTKLYFGVEKCSDCHNKEKDKVVAGKKALLYRGTEMADWYKKDKHKRATLVLSERQGQLMAKNLGWDVTRDARCLRCHGVYVENEQDADEETYSPKDRVESGVSCVACHGAYREWVVEHAAAGGSIWRKLTRDDKKRDYGLNDLWDPEERSTLCCKCHVGNTEEGKFVTHDMYAAGHPPLPGIEIATFCEAMPRHWETLTEKVKKRAKDEDYLFYKEFYKRSHDFDVDRDPMEVTQLVAVSAVVTFRESMRLIVDKAVKGQNAAWPEFALYDCYACHHDLKAKSWRQERGFPGAPGRPQIRPWSTALVPLAIRYSVQESEQGGFDKMLKDLELAFSKTPFGDPEVVAPKAQALVDWSDRLLKNLRKGHPDPDHLLAALLPLPQQKPLDFDSARQVSWGLKTLLRELRPVQLSDDKVKAALGKLDAELMLDLLKGQQEITGGYLKETFSRLANYDPEEFSKNMRAIAEAPGQR
jgi:hypothetical protein